MKKFLFSALVGAMMISCSRDNDSTNPTTPQAPAISQTVILPTKLTFSQTGKADEVATFSYNGNKLVKYTYDNKDQTYTYTGDFITSVRSEDDYTEFNYDSLMETSYLSHILIIMKEHLLKREKLILPIQLIILLL